MCKCKTLGGGGGGSSTPPDIVDDPLVPLMHLSYHLTLYKSRGLEGSFFAYALSVESSLLSCCTPEVFGEGSVWRIPIVSDLLVGFSFDMLSTSFTWIICFALFTLVFQPSVDFRGLNCVWGFGMLPSLGFSQ